MLYKIKKLLESFASRLSELGAMLVWPVERSVQALTHGFFSIWERTEGLFDRLGHGITWPFRMVGRVVAAIGRTVLPESVRDRFGSVGSLPARFFARVLQASEALNLDRPLLWLVWLLQPLWRPLAALGGFVYAWFITRHWRQLLMAVPALVMLSPFAAVWAHSMWVGKGQVVSRYQTSMKDALEAQEYDRVRLYERKLAQLGVDTQLTDYRNALALAEEEKLEEAYQRMKLLAPEDQDGYASAHFWLAQHYMSGMLVQEQIVDSEEESLRLAKVHLDHLETLQLTGQYHQFLSSVWLIREGRFQEASELLQPLVTIMPGAAFERMRVSKRLQRVEQAREDARALITHMTTQQQRGNDLGVNELQWWLAAEEVIGNLGQMSVILDKWLAIEPDNQQAQVALARVYRQQAAQELREPLPDEQKIAKLWLQAAELEGRNEALVQTATELYENRGTSPSYGRILNALRDSPSTPPKLLLAIGTQAAVSEQYEEAREYFKATLERDATNPVAWNNYGLVLGKGNDTQLDEALSAVNKALEIAPMEHRFRETRGQILLRMQRWQEAVDDLEFALNGLPELEAIHQSLATAYDELGEEELAKLHQSQVE